MFKGITQSVLVIPWSAPYFLGITAFLNRGRVEDAVENIKLRYFELLSTGVCFWPFFNFLAFQFIPIHYRTLFFDNIGFYYNIITSHINNKEIKAAKGGDS